MKSMLSLGLEKPTTSERSRHGLRFPAAFVVLGMATLATINGTLQQLVPRGLQLLFGKGLRHLGVELLHDIPSLTVLQVLQDGLGFRDRAISVKLRESRRAKQKNHADDNRTNALFHGVFDAWKDVLVWTDLAVAFKPPVKAI